MWTFRHFSRLPARAIRERGQSERFPAASVCSAQTISMRNPVFHYLIHSSFTSRDPRRRNCQPCNPIKNRGEQSPWHSHFGQLERHVLGVACHLRPDLDELLSQRSERPVLNILRQCQSSQKVRQVVSQGKQLQARLIVLERAAGELRPFDGVLSFFDPLLSVPIIIPPKITLLSS